MNIKVNENRLIEFSDEEQGTSNESNVQILHIEIPEKYADFYKKIVFITDDGIFWDYLEEDNTYTIKNNITKYNTIEFYIWLTKGEQDFRSRTYTLFFNENESPNGEVPEEQETEMERVIRILEEEITKTENLNIEAEKNGNVGIISITDKRGVTSTIEIQDGQDGQDGKDGTNGSDGLDGKSAYQIWLDNGNTGTEQDFLNSLKGENGLNGSDGEDGYTPIKGTDYWTESDKAEIVQDTVEELQPEINNKANKSEVPKKTSDLINDSGFITNTVNNLVNYYLKGEIYTKTEVNNLIGQIATLQFQVVNELPVTGDSKYIYLVPSSSPKTQNIKDEYLWINNSWEQIGSTQIDLTGYATEIWVNNQISSFLTETEIQTLINASLPNVEELQEENERLRRDLEASTLTVGDTNEWVELEDTVLASFKKFEIYGNTKQETMPSAYFPSEIQKINGDIDIEISNKNLFPSQKCVPFTANSASAWMSLDGEKSAYSENFQNKCEAWVLLPAGTYTFSVQVRENANTIQCITESATTLFSSNAQKTFTLTEPHYIIPRCKSTDINQKTKVVVQIEKGEDKTDFVEHQGTSVIFPLNNQTLMYGDYLAENGFKIVNEEVQLTGNENWSKANGVFYADILDSSYSGKVKYTDMLCTHFKFGGAVTNTNGAYSQGDGYFCVSSSGNAGRRFYFREDSKTSVEDWVSFLQSQVQNNIPVKLNYQLLQGETVAYTGEQQAVYNQIKKTIHSYEGVTNIYSTNETSPIFSVEAYKDTEKTLENVITGKNLETANNKVTSISGSSTDTEYPSAKCVYNNEKVLDERISELENNTGHVYGIKRKITNNSSPSWERILDSVGRFANATKDGENVQNDFDSLAPWSEIKSCNYDLTTNEITAWFGDPNFKFDGTNGDVFTYIPKTYWKIYQEDDYEYVLLADYPKEGFTEINSFFVGRYDCTDIGGKLRTYSGLIPTTSRNITQFRNYAQNLGQKFSQLDWRYFVIQMLYLVEYATYDSQIAVGNGIMSRNLVNTLIAESSTNRVVIADATNFYVGQTIRVGTSANGTQIIVDRKITAIAAYDDGSVTGYALTFSGASANIAVGNFVSNCAQQTGQCDSLGMKSGCLNNDGYHSVIYRGMENIYGDVFQFVDGINIKDSQVYFCKDHSQYQTDYYEAPYNLLPYVMDAASNGWVKTLGFTETEPILRLPTNIGGSSSTYMCDYYVKGTGVANIRVGGCSSDGQKNGFWALMMGAPAGASWDRACRILIDS